MSEEKLDIDLDERIRQIENDAIDCSVYGGIEVVGGAAGAIVTGIYTVNGKLGPLGTLFSGACSALWLVSGIQNLNNASHLLKRRNAIKSGKITEETETKEKEEDGKKNN